MTPHILNKQIIVLSAALLLTGAGLTLGVVRMKGSEQKNAKKVLAMRTQYDTIQNNYTRLQSESAQTQHENEQLQTSLAAVTADRDNLLAQVKKGLSDRSQLEELRAAVEQSTEEKNVLAREKDEAVELTKDLQKKIEESVASRKQSEAAYQQLSSEKEQALEALEQLRQKTGVVSVQKERDAFAKQAASLEAQVKSLRSEEGRSREDSQALRRELEMSRSKQGKLTARLSDAERKNKNLEKKLLDGPARFSELARQNKILIAQTASMHYNLGVFYSRQKEYQRAVSEFQKAVELKPNDAASHFNIGYIYAEHLVDRAQAVSAFQKYLEYADKKDKDVD
jgi:chromosome segregation ATPase